MLVGIDVGGTKTRILVSGGAAAAADASGAVGAPVIITDRTVPTDSWRQGETHDFEANIDRLVDVVTGLGASPDGALAVGAHGLDSEWQVDLIGGWLRSRWQGPVQAMGDVELLAPAAGFDDAIAIVVGTGSKIIGHDAQGRLLSVGGYGHILSDPGSAAGLAREAVRAILAGRDRGEAPDALGLAFFRHFAVTDEVALSYAFTGDTRIAAWGALGPLVFDAAASGSRLAADVIASAAGELADGVATLISRGAIGDDVVCAGGVVEHQPGYVAALEAGIRERVGARPVHVLQAAPVFGALRRAELLAAAS